MNRAGAQVRAVSLVWLLSVIALPVHDAAAAGCPSAGGQPVVRTTDRTGDFVVVGGGYGHGVGMSQYGARGAALLGCSDRQILSAYYPGTTETSTLPVGKNNIRVSVVPSFSGQALPSFVDVQAIHGRVKWRLNGVRKHQPVGSTWRARVTDSGRYVVTSGATKVFSAAKGPVRISLAKTVVRLPAKNRRYNRGRLVLAWAGSGARTYVTNTIGNVDKYLYGLAEMPSSWPQAAVRAQAVAGRTYALQRRESRNTSSTKWAACRCDVYDSVTDQVYSAYEWESVAPLWVAAVDATAGRTLQYGGRTITAFYHSSSGGHVENSAFVFGGTLGYSTAFDDSRWEQASSNPNKTWVRVFTAKQIGGAFGVGEATAVSTPNPRGASGRIGELRLGAGGVVVQGTTGSKKVSGSTFRSTMGLPSSLFTVKPKQ